MKITPTQITHFLRSDSGAVTVDWVVLSAGIVALGGATLGVVAGGVETASQSTADELAQTGITTRFFSTETLAEMDFSDGIGDWVGGSVQNLAGFGELLVLEPGEATELSLDVPEGAASATVSFDLIAGDNLDGEPATIFVNGQAVAIYQDDHGNITTSGSNVSGISVETEQQYNNGSIGGAGGYGDSIATYTITVDDPGSTLTLGLSSGADEPTSEEFYGLDNVSVVAN